MIRPVKVSPTDVPIGLLQSFWGGTRIEAWTSKEAFESQLALAPILNWWESQFASFNAEQAEAEYQQRLELWTGVSRTAMITGSSPDTSADG